MRIDVEQIHNAGALVARQAQALTATAQYVPANASIGSGDLGLLLAALYPLNEGLVTLGRSAAEMSSRLLAATGEALHDTLEEYVQAEREAYDGVGELLRRLGLAQPPFDDPRDDVGRLGPAADGAPDRLRRR